MCSWCETVGAAGRRRKRKVKAAGGGCKLEGRESECGRKNEVNEGLAGEEERMRLQGLPWC